MIEKLIYQVGVQCVKRHAEETGTEYEELFAEIRRLRAQIEKEKEELRLATEVKPCPQCGYGNKINSKFCVKCGSSLTVKENLDASNMKEKYCTNCGFKMMVTLCSALTVEINWKKRADRQCRSQSRKI